MEVVSFGETVSIINNTSLHQVYTHKTKKEQGIYPYSTSSADLPARTALILFLAVVTVL